MLEGVDKMSNEYKDWKRDMDEEYYSCAIAFAKFVDDHAPDYLDWFKKNYPTVWEYYIDADNI